MNKVMLIGYVGKDPDVRYYDADQAVAQFSLATTERGYVLQNGTKVPDHTDWHTVLAWSGLAKIVEKYVHKGDRLYIEGRIRYRSYDDHKGQRRYVTEVLAENMELLSPKVNAQEMGNGVPTESMTGNSDQNMNDSQNVSDDSDNEDSSALPF
ncbi:MAG: single-stranded DNA-binding protein [Prevotella sp.]|jgi:single-strand DNA-binding protein|nr:single-stranded DNA-binding protein [Prevotella sp.]MBP6526993.1 single-stranded DNA-binding protein [Prevotella sp.]MBP7097596.1 single-stranded DNA-binding protein [Prevotella sp.]MBP8686686.1 single-stranded DNA-binding protein [Prevotella sp.]MBP8934256.1 single-stranded DNA-binding protein [Prevotella sp.]MBP9982341.1 single-stranded DNA-binding protein [Prevotella sp.]